MRRSFCADSSNDTSLTLRCGQYRVSGSSHLRTESRPSRWSRGRRRTNSRHSTPPTPSPGPQNNAVRPRGASQRTTGVNEGDHFSPAYDSVDSYRLREVEVMQLTVSPVLGIGLVFVLLGACSAIAAFVQLGSKNSQTAAKLREAQQRLQRAHMSDAASRNLAPLESYHRRGESLRVASLAATLIGCVFVLIGIASH